MTVDTSVFARIIKQEKQADGTLLVTGVATDDTLDIDEQICDPAWLERAMPDWFKYGNIREQHSNIAAGVATKLEQDGNKHVITAHIVDPSSIAKVDARVLKGFSIGIRNPRISTDKDARGGRIVDGQIVEVSLVDRPANPSCVLELAKSVGGEMQQTEVLIEKDAVMERCSKCMKAYKADDLDPHKMCKGCVAEKEAADKAVSEESSEESSMPPADKAVAPDEESSEESSEGSDGESSLGEETSSEPGDSVKAVEESSQKIGEESSQVMGEESSRPNGVAGVAGKSVKKDKTAKRLKAIEKELQIIKSLLSDSKSADNTTKAAAESVKELDERLAKVEKSASRGPVRTAVKASAPSEVDAKAAKAAEYRAKAAATSDPALASGYLLLAAEAESK